MKSTARGRRPPPPTGQRELFAPVATKPDQSANPEPTPVHQAAATAAPAVFPLPPAGDTRRAARHLAHGHANSARERVYAAIVGTGSQGATLDDVERVTGLPRSSVSARRNELTAAERIVDSGRRRISKYGAPVAVYVAASGCGCKGA